ncbi:MAG: YifB family Mg chelatase-like AAA ATPase, partial [Candidatus Binatia bacterium]
ELGLDGSIRAVRGVLPIALAAKRQGIAELYVPAANAKEASPLAGDIRIYAVSSLQELLRHLEKTDTSTEEESTLLAPLLNSYQEEAVIVDIDMADVKGQEHAKRALAICAAGGHNALLVGPPGTGKTLLARALVGILPSLSREESYTVTSLYSVAGLLPGDSSLISSRPFRSPHHGASSVALVGGGVHPKPGEVSLAHHGVLFLDELPEFSRHVLEQLRQPIEDGMVTISRAAYTVRFPARSMVVGAMNPCPCGFVGSSRRQCTCSPGGILRYQRRISGPLLDRFDIHVLVNDVPAEELLAAKPREKQSPGLREKMSAARQRQWQRQGKTNAELSAGEVQALCVLNKVSKKLLIGAQDKFHLSSRGLHRILKVSLTIADYEGADAIAPNHIAEALQYREQLKAALPDFV